MFKFKLASILMVLVVLLGAGSSTVFANESPPIAGSTETVEEQLVAIAKAALTAQNRVLVKDDVESVLLEDRLASSYQDSMRDLLVDALDRRKSLATHGVAYTGFDIELTVKRIQSTEVTVTMEAEIHTVLNLDQDDPLAPSTTEYIQDYCFTFTRQGKRWKLTSAQRISPMGPVAPLPGASPIPEDVVPIDLDASKPVTSPPEDVAPVDINLSPDLERGTLDRPGIVSYALDHWEDYNPAYRAFAADCTNFVSQALQHGGWSEVYGWYRSRNVWWYNQDNQSWTWVNADYWFDFVRNRSRGNTVTSFSDLVPGDVVQIDFNKDGAIDHSMIVTYRTTDGTIYLTYHTVDTLNRNIWDIVNDYPSADYYGWHLYNSF